MFSDTSNENDHETNGHQTITDSLHSNSSPNHDHQDDQLEIEEPRGLLGQAISSAFSSIVGALSGKKSRQKSETFESEHVEPLKFSPESKKSEEDKPVMETVMEAAEKEEYAVQEFVPETIVVTETTPSNENHEEEVVVQIEEQEHVEVHDHPNAIEVEDDNDEVQEQSEDVGVTEITIRYQEIVDENSRANVGFDEEKVEEKQAMVEVHEEEERGSNDVEVVEQPVEFRQEMENENVPVREEEENHEQDVIIEEKMEVEAQPEPEPEVQREEEVVQQQYEEKASSHNTEPVVESPNEPERKAESPIRQEIAIDLAQEPHDVLPHEPMLTDMNTLECEEITAALDKEDKLHIAGNIIEVSSEEAVHSQERESLEAENQPMPVENGKPNNESMDRLLQYSPKGENHTNEDVLLDTSHHSNQQMLIENCENEEEVVVPVLEYVEEDHNENDITRIEEPDEIMIEVQDPISECPESQEVTSILPMMEINTESIIVRNLPEAKKTDNNTNNTNNLKKNEPKRGIVPPTRITSLKNSSLVTKKPVNEVKARGIQSAIPKITTTTQIKPKLPPEFAALTAQRKPVVGLKPVVKNVVQQITPKRENPNNKSLTNIPRKPLVTQQQNTVNTKKRKAEEVWTKGTVELKQVKKNNQVPTAKEKERVNMAQIRNAVGTMKPPMNRTPRVSVDKNSSHKDVEPSNENEMQSEVHKSGNKPMCVVCSGIIESRTDSQMLSCLHKIHKRCYLVMEKKKSQCPACNSSTMNRNGFQQGINTTPGSKRQEKKLVY